MTTFLPLTDWGGTPNGWPEMVLPVPNLDVHHSVTSEEIGVHPTDDAVADFQELDALGLARGHGGISYSYAIHNPTGIIGEGQGTRRGAHTAGDGCGGSPWGWNPCTIGVVFIGDFQPRDGVTADVLTDPAIEAFRWLRAKLIADGIVAPGVYPTGGHRDMAGNATACPGDNIEEQLDVLRSTIDPTTEDDMVWYMRCADNAQDGVVSELRVSGFPINTLVGVPIVPVTVAQWDAEVKARGDLATQLSPKLPVPPPPGQPPVGVAIDYTKLAGAITAGIKGL